MWDFIFMPVFSLSRFDITFTCIIIILNWELSRYFSKKLFDDE